jgi:hypothetical protein
MPIEHRNLEAGTRLVARHKGKEPKPRASKPKAKAPKKAAGKKAPAKKTAKGKRGKAKVAPAKSRDSYGCGACGATFDTMTEATEHALTHTQD